MLRFNVLSTIFLGSMLMLVELRQAQCATTICQCTQHNASARGNTSCAIFETEDRCEIIFAKQKIIDLSTKLELMDQNGHPNDPVSRSLRLEETQRIWDMLETLKPSDLSAMKADGDHLCSVVGCDMYDLKKAKEIVEDFIEDAKQKKYSLQFERQQAVNIWNMSATLLAAIVAVVGLAFTLFVYQRNRSKD